MATCNSTLEDSYIHEDPLWKGFTFHHFGLFLAAVFGLVSVVISLWLIFMHATHYLRPAEQRHIIRILFMIPIYSVVSFLSYMFYRKAIYFQVLRDCYEAFAISSFFSLLCYYIAPTLHDQKEFFRTVKPVNWFWGVFFMQKCTGGENKGPLRKPRSGLTWFNVVWVGIFQYCFIRVFFTIVSVIAEAFGRYCESSLSPVFAHIWVLAFECLSVTVAMFMVIQFYIQLKNDLSEHKPFLKVLSIKLVIFFSFWQTIIISLLSSQQGPLQPTKTLASQDIKIGISCVMLCIEMAFFSVLHIFAYPWKPYSLNHNKNSDPLMASGAGFSGGSPRYQGGPMGIKAILDAFNPWDIIKGSARGFRWLFVGHRKRHLDPSYAPAAKLDSQAIGYTGPTYAGSGQPATELQPSGGRTAYYSAEDDRVGLLNSSAAPARVDHSPYRNDEYAAGDDSHLFGAGTKNESTEERERREQAEMETGYHPGMGPASSTTQHDTVHPAYREDGGHGNTGAGGGNNRWAGTTTTYNANEDDSHSVAPSYRTNDPYAGAGGASSGGAGTTGRQQQR